MEDKGLSFGRLYETYKSWVCNNPNLITDVETVATWSSYFVAGKINKSPIVSEVVYCLSKLLCLFNDRLIREAYSGETAPDNPTKENLKLALTVLHYSEVFVELAVRKKWGIRGKWSIATLLQVVKCSSALLLLFKYRELPIMHPAIPALQRRKLTEMKSIDEGNSGCFTLKRSGRTVRRVEGAPPVAFRDWQPVQSGSITQEQNQRRAIKKLSTAETIHILKPLIHLVAMRWTGSQAWKQWLLSLGLDLASLKMYSTHADVLTHEQKVEISRRKLALLLYLLRSPMYNKYTETIIGNTLKLLSEKIPAASFICSPILQYLNHWQEIYFYMWAS